MFGHSENAIIKKLQTTAVLLGMLEFFVKIYFNINTTPYIHIIFGLCCYHITYDLPGKVYYFQCHYQFNDIHQSKHKFHEKQIGQSYL